MLHLVNPMHNSIKMKHVLHLLFFFTFSTLAISQPCVKIESILVAACTSVPNTEGSNEMMRFRVGASPLNVSDMNITWGSGQYAYNGVIQNQQTANIVAQLNNTIQACGLLREPVNGVLPANKSVLIICGLNVSITANSFANLTDTLTVLFHNATNTGGHFLNFSTNPPINGTIDQTTTISFNNNPSCSSTATYFRNLLITTAGTPGNQPGATVLFDDNMNATYINNGCQAPITPYSANWNAPSEFCNSGPIDLNTLVTGTPGGTWSGPGVSGSVFDPTGLTGAISLTYSVQPPFNCPILQPASQTNTVNVVNPGNPSWSAPAEICSNGTPINLNDFITGTPGGTFLGQGVSGNVLNTTNLNANVTITYIVGTSTCFAQSIQTISIISLNPPVILGPTTYCGPTIGIPIQVQQAGSATITWFDSNNNPIATGPTFVPANGITATYSVIQSVPACTSAVTTFTVTFSTIPTPIGDTLYTYCSGNIPPFLSVQSDYTVNWYSDATLTTSVNTGLNFAAPAGTSTFYVVADSGSCQSEPLVINVIAEELITAQIQTTTLSLCEQSAITLSSANPDGNNWSTGETSQSITITSPGIYSLTRQNSCNTAKDSVEVTGAPISAAFEVNDSVAFSPYSVQVTDNGFGSDNCYWIFEGDTLLSIENLVVSDTGTYVLYRNCSNAEGCTASDSSEFKVKSATLVLFIPNVFTPDGDGINDLFRVKHENVKTFDAMIYNRWGNKLYEWTDVNSGWNGESDGTLLPQGTYFYIIKGTDVFDKGFEYKGVVTLLGKS